MQGTLRKVTDTVRATSGSQPGVSEPGPCSCSSGAQGPACPPHKESQNWSWRDLQSLLQAQRRGERAWVPWDVGSFHGLQRPGGPTAAAHFSQLPPEWLKELSTQDPWLTVPPGQSPPGPWPQWLLVKSRAVTGAGTEAPQIQQEGTPESERTPGVWPWGAWCPDAPTVLPQLVSACPVGGGGTLDRAGGRKGAIGSQRCPQKACWLRRGPPWQGVSGRSSRASRKVKEPWALGHQ